MTASTESDSLLTRSSCQFPCGQEPPYDFVIECANGTISVQRDVLISSGYFTEQAVSSMETQGSLKVQISKAMMSLIVDFIYGRTGDLDAENALNLLLAALYIRAYKLIPKCMELVSAYGICIGNAIGTESSGDPYWLRDLAELVLFLLRKTVTPLMSDALFLDHVDAKLMRALLESDDLVVPDEEAVADFLTAWYQRSPERGQCIGELKRHIRVAFLSHSTLARLERDLGPMEGLAELTCHSVNLSLPAFRRRRYTADSTRSWSASRAGVSIRV